MKSDPVSLVMKVSRSDTHLDIHYSLHNGHAVPIFVFDRLWRGASEREPDAEGVYRFVVGRGLRLLLGSSPLPYTSVTFRNLPHVTKVEPFASVDGRLALAVPVTEYNFYFSKASSAERVAEKVEQIELFAEYVEAPGVEVLPSRIHSGAFVAVNAQALENNRTVRSGPVHLSLDVLRQTGKYTRLILPGEPENTLIVP